MYMYNVYGICSKIKDVTLISESHDRASNMRWASIFGIFEQLIHVWATDQIFFWNAQLLKESFSSFGAIFNSFFIIEDNL